MRSASVLTVSSRALLEACERLGLNTQALLDAEGIDRATIDDPDGRISGEKVSSIWRRAYMLSGDPQLALHAAEALPFGAYKVIDFLAEHCETVGEGFETIARYFPLINNGVELHAHSTGSTVQFRMSALEGPDSVPLPYAEYTLAAVYLRCSAAYGITFSLAAADFAYPAPADDSEHRRIFKCPVRFSAKHTQLVLELNVWQQKIPHARPALGDVLRQHAETLLETKVDIQAVGEAPWTARLREAMQSEMRAGEPTLEAVAKRMGLGPRSLQRRLKKEKCSFNGLLDELRGQMATQYLGQNDISISEIAFLLGFSAQSAFTRAFKRWTGITPARFRQQALPVAS